MSFKKILITLLCVSILPLAVFCGGKKGDTIKIGAIFAITGPASFLGAPEEKTARMMVDEINKAGGIDGRNLELVIKDSAGSPEKAISFAKQLIEEEKVFAIIGPSTSGETMKIKSICEEGKTILISCAAAEVIVNPVSKYVFKVAQNDSDAAQMICDVMKKKGITGIGLVSSNDGYGAAGKDQMEKVAARNGIKVLINEVYDKKDTDLSGVLTKVKAMNVQAVVNWSIVPAQSIIPKNMKQLNMTMPLFQSSGFGNIKYAKEAGAAGEGIIFPCGRLLIAAALPDKNPQKAVLMKYKKDYESKYNEDASTFGGHAYDSILVLAEAIKKSGADREKARDALENLTNVPGIAGVFNFSARDHLGLDIKAFEMLTVKDGKFVPYEQK
ncbi:MAG: ABC transporter substrate-binding protein [Spirochaetes bacterium]|nr:MAG: ABC transporter substrate-binding protein [Spirochaetota bacterium]